MLYAALQVGATAVVRRRFSASDYWNTVRESGANVSFLLGAMANLLARQEPRPNDADNPMERMLLVPLVDELDAFRERFNVRVGTCYGSTEVNVPTQLWQIINGCLKKGYTPAVAESIRHPELVRKYRETAIEPRRDVMRAILRAAVATGELRADIDVERSLRMTMVGSSHPFFSK